MIARRARVTGRVQGVGYRAWAAERAEEMGVAGWVRNEADGSVSALIAGPGDRVEAMLATLGEGPRFASVSDVEAEEAEPPAAPGFHVLR